VCVVGEKEPADGPVCFDEACFQQKHFCVVARGGHGRANAQSAGRLIETSSGLFVHVMFIGLFVFCHFLTAFHMNDAHGDDEACINCPVWYGVYIAVW